jgi:hypothetical protein
MDSKQTDPMATLLGGRELTIHRLERDADEKVFVRQLPIKLYPKLRDCLADECAQLELYCDKPPGWAESLTPPQHEQLITVAEEINRDFFSRWLDRQKGRAALLPKADLAEVAAMFEVMQRNNPELLENLMLKASGGSPTSPQKPQSRAG